MAHMFTCSICGAKYRNYKKHQTDEKHIEAVDKKLAQPAK